MDDGKSIFGISQVWVDYQCFSDILFAYPSKEMSVGAIYVQLSSPRIMSFVSFRKKQKAKNVPGHRNLVQNTSRGDLSIGHHKYLVR